MAQRLRADPATAHLPVVMLSARGQAADVERGLAAGASAYLTKPFAPSALVATIRALCRPPTDLPPDETTA